MRRIIGILDRALAVFTDYLTAALLLTITLVVLYSVVMRYVFQDPPFWSDVISMFANMGMILLGLSLTVRGRDLIAMQALYEKISPLFALALDALWNGVILLFSLIYTWYGLEAALNIPGFYWELGGLEQRYPAMIMPVSGVLLIIACIGVLVQDIKKYRVLRAGAAGGANGLTGGPS